jgi:ABC-type amino acid transport substrate-binding protein
VRYVFETYFKTEYEGYHLFVGMGLKERVSSRHFRDSYPPPDPVLSGVSRLEKIKNRGRLRVGYFRDDLPFAYVNTDGELVGFDVEMAHTLAKELNVSLDLVRVELANDKAQQALQNGTVDLFMSGISITPELAKDFAFTSSYLDQTVSFIIEDRRREEFNTREALKSQKHLRIGVAGSLYLERLVAEYLPQAELVTLTTARDFFRENNLKLDALVYSAEAGSAWTLIYPAFSVAIPQPDVMALPTGYATAYGDPQFLSFLNTWIALKKKDLTIQYLYEYWILGRTRSAPQRRWSLLDQLLTGE